jgi:hypothetical protein
LFISEFSFNECRKKKTRGRGKRKGIRIKKGTCT